MFDKTGTLTVGKPVAVNTQILNNMELREFYKLIAATEVNSEHPLAKAIVEYAKKLTEDKEKPVWPEAQDFVSITGNGVKAIVENKEIIVGNKSFMLDQNIAIPVGAEDMLAQAEGMAQTGILACIVSIDKEVAGVVVISDPLKPGAKDVISILKSRLAEANRMHEPMLQLFDRPNALTGRRISHKRLPPFLQILHISDVEVRETSSHSFHVDLLLSFCSETGFTSVILVGHGDGRLLALRAAQRVQTSMNSYSLVLLGDSSVRKSCIVLRFVRGGFDPASKVPVGASFLSQTIALQHSTTIKFEIWDTAGQERKSVLLMLLVLLDQNCKLRVGKTSLLVAIGRGRRRCVMML